LVAANTDSEVDEYDSEMDESVSKSKPNLDTKKRILN